MDVRKPMGAYVYVWSLRASHTEPIRPDFTFLFNRALQVYSWRSYTSSDIINHQQETVKKLALSWPPLYLLEHQPWAVSQHPVSKVVCFSWCWTHLCQESRPPIGVGSNPVTASIQAQFNSARFQCYLQGLIYLNMNMNMGTCTFCHDWSHRRIVPPGWGLTVNSTSKTL